MDGWDEVSLGWWTSVREDVQERRVLGEDADGGGVGDRVRWLGE